MQTLTPTIKQAFPPSLAELSEELLDFRDEHIEVNHFIQLEVIVPDLASKERKLAEAQRRTEEEVVALAEEQKRLAEAQRRTEQELEALADEQRKLAEAQRRTEEKISTS